jgi:hypothetical protein
MWLSWLKFSSSAVSQASVFRPCLLLPPGSSTHLTHSVLHNLLVFTNRKTNNSVAETDFGIPRLLSKLCYSLHEICQYNMLLVTFPLVHVWPPTDTTEISVSVTFTTSVIGHQLQLACHTAILTWFTVFISCNGERWCTVQHEAYALDKRISLHLQFCAFIYRLINWLKTGRPVTSCRQLWTVYDQNSFLVTVKNGALCNTKLTHEMEK